LEALGTAIGSRSATGTWQGFSDSLNVLRFLMADMIFFLSGALYPWTEIADGGLESDHAGLKIHGRTGVVVGCRRSALRVKSGKE